MEPHYKIIGGDGREYGPAGLEELKSWVLDGRVANPTLVWRSDVESWRPASRLPELETELTQSTIPLPTPSLATAHLAAVGFGPRVGAYLVDMFLLNIIGLFLPENEAFTAFSRGETITADQLQSVLASLLLGLVITAIYHVGLNGSLGATIGKLLIGARIVRADGARLGFRRAGLRFLCESLSFLTVGVGFLLVGFRPDHRALHDLLGGTRVVWIAKPD